VNYTNANGLPEVFLRLLKKDRYQEGFREWLVRSGLTQHPDVLSVTTLGDSARVVELRRRHGKDFIRDVADSMDLIDGMLVHLLLEQGGLEAGETIVEERIYFKVLSRSRREWIVTGAPDSVAVLKGAEKLSDWKRCKVQALMPKSRQVGSWTAQTNVYAAILERTMALPFGTIKDLEIVAWAKDHSKKKAREARSNDYPAHAVTRIPIKRWDQVTTHRYLLDRLEAHEEARYGELPQCLPSERWQDPLGWAVKLQGNKKATHVFSSLFEAEEYRDKMAPKIYEIEERLSEPTRCLDWCPALPFCPQGQALVAPKPRAREPEDDGLMEALVASIEQLETKGGEA
jgi:hypothetical protein